MQLSSESMIATSWINNNYGDFLKNGISSSGPTHINVLKKELAAMEAKRRVLWELPGYSLAKIKKCQFLTSENVFLMLRLQNWGLKYFP